MNFEIEYKNRQVIPRWFPSNFATLLGQTRSTSEQPPSNDFELKNYLKVLEDWQNNPNIIYALDFLAYSLILNKENSTDIERAIKLLSKNKKHLPSIGNELLNLFLSDEKVNDKNRLQDVTICDFKIDYKKNISNLKRITRFYPHDPISWTNLSFYYTIVGKLEKAKKCMYTALGLNKINRFILRSASRFFLHADDPERSLYILRNNDITKIDPWLLSAEISISEILEKKSKNIIRASTLLNDDNINPFHKSELGATLATLEFSHGKSSKGRKFVDVSLINPNENTLAQLEYLSKNFKIDDNFSPQLFNVSCNYEALTWHKYNIGHFHDAFKYSLDWIKYQPFSSRPAILSSYISSIGLNDDNTAIDILNKSLIASPNDTALLNNLAFSYCNLNKLEEAIKILYQINRLKLSSDQKAIVSATTGLLAFRSKNSSLGKKLYSSAIEYFTSTQNYIALSRASFFYARELKRIGDNQYKKYLKQSKELAENLKLMEIIKNIEILD